MMIPSSFSRLVSWLKELPIICVAVLFASWTWMRPVAVKMIGCVEAR